MYIKAIFAVLLAALFSTASLAKTTNSPEEQIRCLASAVYHEARGESRIAQLAILNVIQNRVKDPRFPGSYCSVVHQRTGRRCQFSWVCSRNSISNQKLYDKFLEMSRDFYHNNQNYDDPTNGAKFFHSKSVNPGWKYRRSATIGNHIFYRG